MRRPPSVEVLHAREDHAGGDGTPEALVVTGLPLDDQVAEVVGSREVAVPSYTRYRTPSGRSTTL